MRVLTAAAKNNQLSNTSNTSLKSPVYTIALLSLSYYAQ
jgi:hypothetical protein